MTTQLPNTTTGRRLNRIACYAGVWLLLTLWLRLALPESLMGWERHQLFRFSADYLTFFSTKPYPVLLYVQAFFTQFYLYPLLGAAVMAGLMTLGIGAWHRLTGRFGTGLVWTACMLPLLPYFNLLWVLVWLVLLGGGLLINLRRLSPAGRMGLTAGLALAGAFILQENVVFALVFWSLIGGLRTRSWKNGLYGLAAGLAGATLGIGWLVWQAYPLYYSQHLHQWPLLLASSFAFGDFPTMFFACPILIRLWLYAGLALALCLPFTVLLPSFKPQPTAKRKGFALQKGTLLQSLIGLIVAVLLITAGYINLRCQMEDFHLVDRLGSESRWTEALDAADLAFYQRAPKEHVGSNRSKHLHNKRQRAQTLAGRMNIPPLSFQKDIEANYMAEMLKICLLAKRLTTSSLFSYNGSSFFPPLFPSDILYMVSSHMMACYYTDNHFYAEALHILYDLVTSGRISTAVLEPLLWNSVVVGDYAPCRKFIRFFEQSLFHKDIARHYTAYLADTAQMARQPEIAAARLRLSTRNHTVLAYFPDDNIHFRLQHESDNAAVYEYALALWMVYKNHNRILAELPKIRQYYQTLPTHIQEAVLACFPAERLDEVPDDIDPRIQTRYIEFLQVYGLYQNGYTSFQKLKKGFEDTYWYHSMFNDFRPITENQPTKSGGKI